MLKDKIRDLDKSEKRQELSKRKIQMKKKSLEHEIEELKD